MTHWTAVVPLKLGPDCKSRLAALLSPEERRQLLGQMARHVVDTLGAVEAVDEVMLLGPHGSQNWSRRCIPDGGRGLNAELNAVAATIDQGLLVIHGDLPCVGPDDIVALLDAAEHSGCAIAPDRHGQGTNALALRNVPSGIAFAFGDDSFAKHHALFGNNLAVIDHVGLACDIDTPADLEFAISRGCLYQVLTA